MSASTDHSRPANRLALETSPYLRQHAHNPVDWFPWGEEAFSRAREENRPIFLSVGYSACHWCHVMERESFENEAIARYLNDHFISIKVDREERPDVDQIYMSAVQLITRRGGWPMSVFLTPDGKPFYGGTYWPPVSRMGMPGFGDLLVKLSDYWNNKREEVDASAQQLAEAVANLAAPVFERTKLDAEVLRGAMTALISSADRQHGGFGGAPKFPHPMDLRVLLRCWQRFGDERALQTVTHTLTKMANGGIYDHLGGGFHRYSTDARWLVPHFEKMLYDNALLVPAYLEAYQATGDPLYARVVRETLDYVLREMTSPEGGFFSTQDADSEGVEGKFFVWSEPEIDAVLNNDSTLSTLNPQPSTLFKSAYDVSPHGNWEDHNILNRPRSSANVAAHFGITTDELERVLAKCRALLFAQRKNRIPPGTDEKILTSWNGLMIAAMAQAASVLDEPRYCEAAERAADFILTRLRDAQGRLLHSFKDGRARFTGYLEDYAGLIDGLAELFQATAEERWLEAALALSQDVQRRFADEEEGGYFFTANDHEELIARTKDAQDNATPSGNGLLATALLKLARLMGREDLELQATRTLDALGGLLVEHPLAAGQALIALDFLLGPTLELVLAGKGEQAAAIRREVFAGFVPRKVFIHWPAGTRSQLLEEVLAGKTESGPPRLYLCERGRCGAPVEQPEQVRTRISKLTQVDM